MDLALLARNNKVPFPHSLFANVENATMPNNIQVLTGL